MNNHREQLQKIFLESEGLKKRVANLALKMDNLKDFFNNAISKPMLQDFQGDMMITTFFTRYYDEIEQARKKAEEDTGVPVAIVGDTMTFLSGLALSLIAKDIALQCGFEVSKKDGEYILK